jgi:hypothetical protein
MRLASAGRAKKHDIGTLIEPAVAAGRGRMASWLKSKHDGGEKIEKYLV